MKKRVLSLVMALVLALSLAPAAFAAELPALTVTQETALPSRDWQKTASFPDWKGYTDNTLALNSTVSFYGYHGQGRHPSARGEAGERSDRLGRRLWLSERAARGRAERADGL